MEKIIATILICVALAGCIPKPIIRETVQKEEVPVFVVPKPPDVGPRPVLDTSKLTDTDRKDISVVAKAAMVDIAQLTGYASSLELIVNKYKELSNIDVTITDPQVTNSILDTSKLKALLNAPPKDDKTKK